MGIDPQPAEAEPLAPDGRGDEVTPDDKDRDLEVVGALLEVIQRVEAKIDARLAYDTTKEAAFQHLYADLRDAKVSATTEATRPLLLDLALLYDRLVAAARENEAVPLLQSFRDEVLEILYRRDVHVIRPVAERFDPEMQQVVGTVEAVGAHEDQLVDRVVRDGFRWGTRLLRPQDVVIRRGQRPPRVVDDESKPAEQQGE